MRTLLAIFLMALVVGCGRESSFTLPPKPAPAAAPATDSDLSAIDPMALYCKAHPAEPICGLSFP